MRTVQNAHNATLVDQKGNGIHLASKLRVMTTMTPSMKDKLRRNLQTFNRDEPMIEQ